jgi:enamine deaminase RidA (YjgF/YER057c/UK114 family)
LQAAAISKSEEDVNKLIHRRTFVAAAAATLAAPVATQAQQSKETPMSASSTAVEHLNPDGMLKSPVFSQGIIIPAGARTLIIGGQDGVDETGKVVSNDLAGQTAKAVDNVVRIVEAAGGTIEDLVRVAIYIKGDGDIRPGFEEWMKRWAQRPNPPTVVGIRVAGLAVPDALIEIEATAVLK